MARKRKSNSKFNRQFKVQPKSEGQRIYLESLQDREINYTVCTAPAGCGKSYIACYHAAKQLLEGNIGRIYIARSPITVKSYSIGHIPGSMSEKYEPFLLPMIENFKKFLPEFSRWKSKIETLSLAHIRGRSLEDCCLIVDEAQNLNVDALKSVFTRISRNSKLILTGDTKQSDLTSGITDLEKVCESLEGMPSFEWVRMDSRDQQRNKNITEILRRFKNIE